MGRPKKYVPLKVPYADECYPVNLLIRVLSYNYDDVDVDSVNPWEYDIQAFEKVLTNLSDREQRVLDLIYRLGMNCEQAGSEFKVTRNRINQLEHKALRRLKPYLKQCKAVSVEVFEEYLRLQEEVEKKDAYIEQIFQILDQLSPKFAEVVSDAMEREEAEIEAERIENHDIDDLELSVRAYNCLRRAGIYTIGDIIAYDQDEHRRWNKVRNLGRKSFEEITHRMKEVADYQMEGLF